MLSVVSAPALRADGIVIPPVAAPPVAMPDQRALLVWHESEKTETLVIESRFTGGGHDFGWVVPLPSRPEITPASRGTLPTAAAMFRLKLANAADYAPLLMAWFSPWALVVILLGRAHGREFFRQGWVLLAPTVVLAMHGSPAAVSMIGLAIVWRLAHQTAQHWREAVARGFLTAFAILMILGPGLMVPLGASGGPPVASRVEVGRRIVDDYEVSVLAGGDGGDIARWLGDNHFALPAAAEPVVAEHGRAGGFFAAVRLRRGDDSAQPTAPAPLVFTFKTPQPVYPMKLTGAGATQPLAVELFVFGDARAEIAGLTVQSCERVERAGQTGGDVAQDAGGWIDFTSAEFIRLEHPELCRLCGDAHVATRLTGTLQPAQMNRDLAIHWQPYDGPVAPVRFSTDDAFWLGALATTAGLTLAALVRGRCWRDQGPPWSTGLLVVVAALALGGAVWRTLPTVPVLQPYLIQHHQGEMSSLFQATAAKLAADDRTVARLRKVVQPALAAYARAHGIDPPEESDSPGNYVFRLLPEGRWRLVWFDANGSEKYWSKFDL
jgi:hypothetical protein